MSMAISLKSELAVVTLILSCRVEVGKERSHCLLGRIDVEAALPDINIRNNIFIS